MDLFDQSSENTTEIHHRPLADILRPTSLKEVVGQEHLVGENRVISALLSNNSLPSIILWGPPGSGKTTMARIIAQTSHSYFCEFSAVTSGISDIKKVVAESKDRQKLYQQKTIVFIDEIHRFNKAQQDAFLPHIESGTFTLIGATTENPSFSIVSALLSRSRVFVLDPLGEHDLEQVLQRAIAYYAKHAIKISIEKDAVMALIRYSDGDARRLLTSLESIVGSTTPINDEVQISVSTLKEALQYKHLHYDTNGEEHYNLISALHKSVRDSDSQATVYWLVRMLEAGEDPMYVARRLVRMASEDIGLADPQALIVAISAMQSVEKIGMPESAVILAEAAIYLALAPKSNSVYIAYGQAKKDVEEKANLPVPLHLRNAPTNFMKSIGYGKGYKYAHDAKDAKVDQEHLPEPLRDRVYYQPTNRGWEGQKDSNIKDELKTRK